MDNLQKSEIIAEISAKHIEKIGIGRIGETIHFSFHQFMRVLGASPAARCAALGAPLRDGPAGEVDGAELR